MAWALVLAEARMGTRVGGAVGKEACGAFGREEGSGSVWALATAEARMGARVGGVVGMEA